MRKIIFSIPITLDGYIEGPNRERDWVIADDDLHDFATDLFHGGDLLIYGRVTYELMAAYWPTADTDPNATASQKRFANALNPMRKIVYSKTLKEVGWNTQLRPIFDPQEIRAMKAAPGGNILLSGGAAMAREFFRHDLVDEYIPIIQPAAIGKGNALFGGLEKPPQFALKDTRKFSSGTVALFYQVNNQS